jgi:hypothetical protein
LHKISCFYIQDALPNKKYGKNGIGISLRNILETIVFLYSVLFYIARNGQEKKLRTNKIKQGQEEKGTYKLNEIATTYRYLQKPSSAHSKRKQYYLKYCREFAQRNETKNDYLQICVCMGKINEKK